MDMIQTDVSGPALVAAIRDNLCAFFHYLGRSSPENFFENERFIRWHMPIAHPWFNGVLSSLPPEETDTGFIEDSLQYFKAQKVGRFTWWMEPHLKVRDWEPILSRYGFVFANDTPGMAMDLQTLGGPAQTVDGLEVRQVTDDKSLRTWAHVFTTGYGLPAEWEPSVYEMEQKLGLDLPIQNFLGYWNGEPVATSSLFIGRGVAGIYNVSTLSEARGKGIGAALTLHPLRDAREMGYRIGVLQSSEMGYNVYQKLGFQHLCQIEYFQRAPG
jgi:ribosomal protein S18 acetylase RimI-like enzyme